MGVCRDARNQLHPGQHWLSAAFSLAILNGMFSQLEEPKLTMLINERMLDRLEEEQSESSHTD